MITIRRCACEATFDFITHDQYRKDGWGHETTYTLHDNFDAWQDWVRAHSDHGIEDS